MFGYLVLGWCVGYVWCRVWRLGRPEKHSFMALVAGYLVGRTKSGSDRSQL